MRTSALIVEIEILERAGRNIWMWRALHGQSARGEIPLCGQGIRPGERLAVEISTEGARWVVRRIVRGPAGLRLDTSQGSRSLVLREQRLEPHPALTGGAVRPGDVLLLRFRFSRDDATGRRSKQRPCLVMEVTDHECRVRPIHGSNSFVRREGTGRRIRDWAGAGLRKPSVVSAQDHWVRRDSTGAPIGRIRGEDLSRLLGEGTG